MRKVILSIILMLLLLLTIFITSNQYGKTTLRKAAQINTNEITKIEFFHQQTHKIIKVEDKKKIEEFIGYLENCIIKKEKESEHGDKVGYIYYAKFYSNTEKGACIVFVNPVQVNNEYYNVIKSEISMKKIDDFLKDVK